MFHPLVLVALVSAHPTTPIANEMLAPRIVVDPFAVEDLGNGTDVLQKDEGGLCSDPFIDPYTGQFSCNGGSGGGGGNAGKYCKEVCGWVQFGCVKHQFRLNTCEYKFQHQTTDQNGQGTATCGGGGTHFCGPWTL